jgi:hypothetical protein
MPLRRIGTHQGVRVVQTTDEARQCASVRSSGEPVNLRGLIVHSRQFGAARNRRFGEISPKDARCLSL